MLIFNSTNLSVRANGYAKLIPTKVHRNVTESTNGIEEETFVRGKMNYDITITKMEQADYLKMIDIFLYENDFGIIDTDRNFDGQHYKLSSDEFSLQEVENKKDKSFYYTGNFRLIKI